MSFLRRFELPSANGYYDDVYVVWSPQDTIDYLIEQKEVENDFELEEIKDYDVIWNKQDRDYLKWLIKVGEADV
ncbi:MAG: hypothetical protein HUJ68_02895 [Clostridia bacterium]|nr:hypothetical protein [Clostridia bacterium]